MHLKSWVYVLAIFLVCANCVSSQYDEYNDYEIGVNLSGSQDNTEQSADFINVNTEITEYGSKVAQTVPNITNFSENKAELETRTEQRETITTFEPKDTVNVTSEEPLVHVHENKNLTSKTLLTQESKNNVTNSKNKKNVDSSSSSSTTSKSTTSATSKHPPIVIPTLSFTTPIFTTTEEVPNYTETPSFWASFNLNYLYFLLLLIPIVGIIIGIVFIYRKRRKGYAEPSNARTKKTRRLSTPSWVFSEPDFADEEVVTLQEEK